MPSAPDDESPYSQELIQGLRKALRVEHPVDLLTAVSSLVSVTDPRSRGPFTRDEIPQTSLDDLVESFVGVDIAETTAALTLIATFTSDELLAARIGRLLAGRRQPMPAWMGDLDKLEVRGVVSMKHVLADGDDYFVEARLPGDGSTLTALVYVDHNMGTIVKDAFVIPGSIEAVRQRIHEEKMADPDTTWADADPAETRAVIEEAIEHGALLYPPAESETWPMCRPLVEWLVRRLPAGGIAPKSPEWTDEELATLREDFFASTFGRPLDRPEMRSLLEDITWFGTGWAGGDPLRWSPVNVEILLVDWIPRKIVAEVELLTDAPARLRGFIRYCHDRRQIRPALTTETLTAVDRWEPDYQQQIRDTGRLQGAEALAALLAEGYDNVQDRPLKQIMLEALERAVGGPVQLANLALDPLPDEEFGWPGIPEDIQRRVREVLELVDRYADEVFDVEHRTAFRRFLARAAVGDPGIFRRQEAAVRAAAAVCWAVGRVAGGAPNAIQSKELERWFGVKGSVAQRAEVFLKALGLNPDEQYGGVYLETPHLLVSERRAQIVELCDRYQGMDDDL